MKKLFAKGLCLALGITPLYAFGEELNFRAVAPRATAPSSDPIPVSLSRPTPASDGAVFRGKIQDEGEVIVPAFAPRGPGVRLVQKDVPVRPAPLPAGAPGEFIPPPPQMIAPPPGASPMTDSSPAFISGGPVVTGPATSYAASPGNCSSCSGGFSLFDGLIAEDPLGACCGNACGDSCCGDRWHPFQHIADFFCCNCNTGCCPPRSPLWIRGEYLLWNVTRQSLPPLVTQAPSAELLALNSGQSVLLYGNSEVPTAELNGIRVAIGFWFPNHCDWGLDASYFSIGNRRNNFVASSNGTPALGRPYNENSPIDFDPVFNSNQVKIVPNQDQGPNAQVVADPGLPTPGAVAVATNTYLWNADLNLRRKLCCGPNFWIDGLIGYRHFQLEDTLTITESIGQRRNNIASSESTYIVDSFGTRNVFNGGQIGIEAEWRFRPRWTVGGSLKVAAGNMNQAVNIDGSTTLTNARFANNKFVTQETQSGGLLAQPSNIGRHTVDRFAVIPEVGVKLGLDVTPHLRLYAGYNLLYVSNVVRAGEQVDLNVNTSQRAFGGYTPKNAAVGQNVTFDGSHGVLAPNSPATPAVLFRTSEFWAQGVNFGMEYRY